MSIDDRRSRSSKSDSFAKDDKKSRKKAPKGSAYSRSFVAHLWAPPLQPFSALHERLQLVLAVFPDKSRCDLRSRQLLLNYIGDFGHNIFCRPSSPSFSRPALVSVFSPWKYTVVPMHWLLFTRERAHFLSRLFSWLMGSLKQIRFFSRCIIKQRVCFKLRLTRHRCASRYRLQFCGSAIRDQIL